MKTWHYVTFLILVVVVMGGVILKSWLMPFSLAEERAAARAAGLPLSEADLNRQRPPVDRDAGPLWLDLSSELDSSPLDLTGIETALGPDGLMTPTASARLDALRSARAGTMTRMREAAAMPEAFFLWTMPALPEQYSAMRTAAKLLRLEALDLARRGRWDEAVGTLDRCLNIGAQLASHDPILLDALVAAAVDAIGLKGMEDVLRAAGPDARSADAVAEALRRRPFAHEIGRVLPGEAAYSMDFLKSAVAGAVAPGAPVMKPASGAMTGPLNAAFLHVMTLEARASKLPMPERLAERKRIVTEMDRPFLRKSPTMVMAAQTPEMYVNVETRLTLQQAKRAVLVAAAEALAFRARTGAWPAALADLGADIPKDPFNNKPLGYHREKDGFVTFSAGPTLAFAPKPGQPEKGEALFRYP